VIVTVRPMSYTHRPGTSFSRQLDAEWARLRTSRRSLRTVGAWADRRSAGLLADAVTGIRDLDDLLVAIRSGDEDALLAQLIDLARTEELAARIVVQRILPGLTAGSRRYRDYADDTDPVEVVVASAWIAIRQFDTARRRRHIAASLISDAVFQAFRRPLRRRSATEVPRSPDHFTRDSCDTLAEHPFLELASVVREARLAGVPDGDLQLIRDLAGAESPRMVASSRQVTARTIRNHRDRAVSRIRAALDAAA